MRVLSNLLKQDRGATAIEYGLMAALLAVIVLASISLLGDPVKGLFSGVSGHYDDVNSQL